MAAFSSSQQPLFMGDHFAFNPNFSAIKIDGTFDGFMPNLNQFNSSSGSCQRYQNQEGYSFDASAHESISCVEQQSVGDKPCLNEKQRTADQSLSMVDKTESGEQVTQNWVPVDKKKKSRKGSSLTSASSKDAKQGKCKKQKGDKGAKNDEHQVVEEPPKGYIHVRARRGQATDSHSLAERVRREKISERMRTLQALVPGCEKVNGKALMLDEIINYVQSLQSQVEFLSMKLASLDPMVYTFGLMDPDALVFGTEEQGLNNSMAMTIPLLQPDSSVPGTCNNSQPKDFSHANSSLTSSTNNTPCSTPCTIIPSPFLDTSTSLLQQQQQHEEKPVFFTNFQDVGISSYLGVNEQLRQSLINQFGFSANNLYSLQ